MKIAEIYVNGVTAVASGVKKIPKGIIGATVKVTFANEWADLAKTAVFQGVVTKDVLVDGNSITIPAECVDKSGYRLRVGFYGVADETLAIPTIWTELGTIRDATDPSGDTSTDPTLPVWAQLQDQVDNMTAHTDEQIQEAIDKYLEENPGVDVDLTGYAKEQWVKQNYQPKGEYLTAVPDGYAKIEDIPTRPEDIGAQPSGNYLTEVPEGYATEEFVKNKIAEAELGGEEVDLSGYAQKSELPTKVSQLQNDSGYLTEHQDISGKLDASALPTAINTALAQAKASGEFDGKDGVDGKDGTSVTHSWSGTTLNITSASGTSSADLKGAKGDKGEPGADGAKGDKGDKGDTGANGKDGADGKTPVKGVDYWTEADQESIVQDVIAALGTPVFGRVDGENNIILTGELADGTYTIKYEDVDGNVKVIGTLTHDGKDEPTYTNQIPISTDTDGSIYNASVTPGYKSGVRLSSSSGYTEKAVTDKAIYLTGFIPVVVNDVIRFENITIPKGTDQVSYIYVFDSEKQNGGVINASDLSNVTDSNTVYDENNNLIQFTVTSSLRANGFAVGYLRFAASAMDETSVITINEEIV